MIPATTPKKLKFLLLVMWVGAAALGNLAAKGEAFRPPAVPLVVHDPYFSIWSSADRLTDADTVHWTGKPHRLAGLVRIDRHAFRVMGAGLTNVPALPQVSVEVTPTRTIYTFEGEGVRLTLTFMTPVLADDLEILSRPVTYVTWTVEAIDGKGHEVSLYFDASAEIAVNEQSQTVVWKQETIGDLTALKLGSKDQSVLAKKGDDLRIDWGYLYVAAPGGESQFSCIQRAGACQSDFVANGLTTINQPASGQTAQANLVAGIFVFNLGLCDTHPTSRWLMLAYDDEFSISYFKQNLRPYWRHKGDDAAALLTKAAADYKSLEPRCKEFDKRLMAALRRVGGRKYAQLCALAYRQTLGGNKICADADGQPLMFPKECFSNGCIGTVDVLFPQAPFFLVFSPALTKAMLVPILDYAVSPLWPYAYAPHDLGTYPHARGQVYGMKGTEADRMPVEESGNMLIMLAALSKEEGKADCAQKYWPLLTRWADYLVRDGLDPQNQLCSADMFGHLPRNANLALKAIIGIGGFSQLCDQVGKPAEAKRYLAIAHQYAAKWQELAGGEGHTLLAYGQPGTWSMKHNLIWDRVLGPNLFPQALGDSEVNWYHKVESKYGLPVDNRTDTCLIDWAAWSIALARNKAEFEALFDPLWHYANETPSRVPLSDWFIATDARQKGFQARPVVGGLFMRMLAEAPTTSTKP